MFLIQTRGERKLLVLVKIYERDVKKKIHGLGKSQNTFKLLR